MENYFTIPQSPLIKDTVCSFWQLQSQNHQALIETVLPKGIIEVIFSFETTKLYARVNEQSLSVPRCFIQGFLTSPVQLKYTNNHTIFGVVLSPTAIKHIFHVHPYEFANSFIDLTLIDRSVYALWHRLGEQNSFDDRVTTFTAWLKQRLPQFTDREMAFNDFLKMRGDTHFTVSEIASHFCYSPKQLSRKLNELTGMNTEQTLRYKKYLQAVHLMHSSELSLTKIAYSCHFSDQSHLIKVFKSLSQITPTEYRQRKSHIEGHIFENVR